MTLLDTHVLIWLRSGDSRLGTRTRTEVDQALQDGGLAVSAISFWELAMLRNKGRIELHFETGAWRKNLLDEGLLELPVDGDISLLAANLADFHADPADRFIVATALTGHQLVTADRRILQWPGNLSRLDATR